MGCELRVFEASNKIKACLMTAKGMIGVVLQVYSSDGADSPSMVEVSDKNAMSVSLFVSAPRRPSLYFPVNLGWR